jgi:hypothetical protein
VAGAILERELTRPRAVRVEFGVASQADDAEIRRLLRENPMSGKISVSLEREPDYFADADLPGERKQTIIARQGGRVVCVGSCCIRRRFVNGKPRDVGYLGGLRLDATVSGRFDILRGGYEFFRQMQAEAPADFYFTSIASDNERARRVLERGLPGMPSYEFIGEFVSALIPTPRTNTKPSAAFALPATELAEFINGENQMRQFAPCWTAKELQALEQLGLQRSDFFMLHEAGKNPSCGAIWDQRCFKQTVIRDYEPWLKCARVVLNALGQITNRPQLPATGETLSHAFACHLVAQPESEALLIRLIRRLLEMAAQRRIQLLTVGLAVNDARLNTVRRHFRCREYRSRIYIVRWPGIGGESRELDGRVLAPEVALL